ncbi:urease accessory protein UreD [Tomitella gaofuii]|uniref:urease accessory protein UreD n=1 Tax=Tomitella gaofuii TaxID=2760083 RepID=UPI0015FB28A7|nr:urease accessory protein UreD [Tomitella gaofuii]
MTERPARIGVELVDGRVRLADIAASRYLQPRPLGVDGDSVRIALVGRYAMLLAGDDLRIDITVGPGVRLEIVEPSGTVAYDARGGDARWSATARVAEGGSLVWRSSPFVVTAGADLSRETSVDLAEGATALLAETLVLGRSYETGAGPLRSRMCATQCGRPLLVEDLDLRSGPLRSAPGVLDRARVLASVMLFGARPAAAETRHETLLAGRGALARALSVHAHEAEDALAETWSRWRTVHAAAQAEVPSLTRG